MIYKRAGKYKIVSYTEQKLNNKSLLPIGDKVKKYAIYKETFPFPNKTIGLWKTLKDGFKTEKEAIEYLEAAAE